MKERPFDHRINRYSDALDVADNDPETLWRLADLLEEIAKIHESPREEMPNGE